MNLKNKITVNQLISCFGTLAYGITPYRDILIVWDEDFDGRIFTMIDERFTGLFGGKDVRPLAVSEHEGSITLLWATKADAKKAPDDYTTECDYWCPEHFFLDGDEAARLT